VRSDNLDNHGRFSDMLATPVSLTWPRRNTKPRVVQRMGPDRRSGIPEVDEAPGDGPARCGPACGERRAVPRVATPRRDRRVVTLPHVPVGSCDRRALESLRKEFGRC
jgi:hypothetical protein